MEEDYTDLFELKPMTYYKDLPRCFYCSNWTDKDFHCSVESCIFYSNPEKNKEVAINKTIFEKIKDVAKKLLG